MAAKNTAIVCAGLLLTATTALAQPVPDAGSTLRQLEPPTLMLPRKPSPALEVQPPARPVLQPAPPVQFTLKSFRITGATVFSDTELQQLLQQYVGRQVGIAELGEAVGRLTRFYFEHGYPLATAYLPAQDIKEGVIELTIIEGRFGNVQLVNRSAVTDRVISSYVEDLPGRIVREATLERKLLLIYDLPGIVPAKALLFPGEAIGETDLRLELDAGRRIVGAVELDNYGNRFTGGNRLSGQIDFLSPTKLGDRLSARGTKGDPGLDYGQIRYQLPFGGDGFQAGFAYARAEYRLGKDFAVLRASGEADTWSASASYPFIRSRRLSLYARAGYERKVFQDRVDATGTVTDKSSRLATLALAGDYFDALGAGGASAFSLNYGTGRLGIDTPAASAADDATARTAGSFSRWSVNYARLQNITESWSAYVSYYGQKAGKNLDSSEKMILGGAYGVRAYPQGEAPGDTGYLLTVELRHAFRSTTLPGSLQLAGFIDTGEIKTNEAPFAAGPNRRRLSGGGLGLNWSSSNDFVLRVAVSRRIGNAHAISGSDRHTRGWIQGIKYL